MYSNKNATTTGKLRVLREVFSISAIYDSDVLTTLDDHFILNFLERSMKDFSLMSKAGQVQSPYHL